jgi:hypothetical protein
MPSIIETYPTRDDDGATSLVIINLADHNDPGSVFNINSPAQTG